MRACFKILYRILTGASGNSFKLKPDCGKDFSRLLPNSIIHKAGIKIMMQISHIGGPPAACQPCS